MTDSVAVGEAQLLLLVGSQFYIGDQDSKCSALAASGSTHHSPEGHKVCATRSEIVRSMAGRIGVRYVIASNVTVGDRMNACHTAS